MISGVYYHSGEIFEIAHLKKIAYHFCLLFDELESPTSQEQRRPKSNTYIQNSYAHFIFKDFDFSEIFKVTSSNKALWASSDMLRGISWEAGELLWSQKLQNDP